MERRKVELRDELPQEPLADDPDAVRVLLKLPNGTRLERRFLKSHSLTVTSIVKYIINIYATVGESQMLQTMGEKK